jgi:hypothetical protein
MIIGRLYDFQRDGLASFSLATQFRLGLICPKKCGGIKGFVIAATFVQDEADTERFVARKALAKELELP